ncbi:hypothetical protein GCM10011512_08640 [Tersicoccus solisilvae]|uniref:PKD domain-containing protein n=1 Tax=Tersicoccus solisilvae TaxID=1882339 RepID=A0ABQ1NSX8_9MICC|nr:hypothetical protein [Tersicoccus solisilvae]GGC84105.1 hypothetical protein GCM10011512_08640 [Tersicoccus solisilvae]
MDNAHKQIVLGRAGSSTVSVKGVDIPAGAPILIVPQVGPKISYEVEYREICSGNNPNQTCISESVCDKRPGNFGLRTSVRATVNGKTGDWEAVGSVFCSLDALPVLASPDGKPARITSPTVTLADLKRLNVLAASSVVQPSPHTLRGAETNVYAVSRTQTFTTRIQTFDVTIRAIPIAYTFHYGDGTSLGPVQSPGAPIARDRWGTRTPTSHVYRTTGSVGVTVSTIYRGEYTYNGRPYQPIPGTISVDSAPVGLTIWRARAANVADDCATDPNGWACGLPTR